ncbi:hypothetical protein JG687_00015171, partial [Phytophthora cactorum]
MAYNADGFGSATSPLASAVTCWQPQPPQSVVASVVDGTTLAVSWSAVEEACSVDKYKVEWYRAEGTKEQQTITTSAGWTNPLFDGGSSLKSYQVEWDEQEDFSSGQTSSATIPIVREMQSVVLQSQVVNEEQFVDVTVEVVNEQQEVRSTFTGLDEIQVIKTTNDIVKDEVQKVVTSAADGNEIQELHLDDDDIDEIQAIRSASNSYVIPNLLAGINYYVHVAAMTDIGTGLFSATGSIMPSGTASAVQNIHAGYAVYEREVQEIRLAASHVSEVQEITTEAASIAEVQTLRTEVKDPTNLGSFKTIGAKTGAISWNADASTVKNELVLVVNGALTTNDIVVTRDGDASEEFGYGYVFQITFIGNNVAGETKKIDCADKTFVTTGNVPSSCGVTMDTDIAMGTDTAVQQVIVTAKKPLVAGSYSLRFTYLGARKDSSCIPFDASASIMDITLEAMDNIDKVYVTRQRDSIIAPNGFIYRIFFHGNGVNGDVNKLDFVMCTDFQTQEKNALTTVGVDGQVLISMVDYGGFNPLNTFVSAASATAAQLTTDLAQLPVFGDVLVSQSLVDEQGGYIWTVAFKDSEGNLPQFICAVDSIFESAAGAGCETDTLTDGNVLSGSFLIEASSPIPFNADAGTMKAALEAMAWVGTVQVKQSAASSQRGYTWTITFLDYRGDVPTLLVTSSLVGTGSQISVREVRKGNALGGTFSVSYQNSETAAIDWDELAMAAAKPDGSSMQEKIQALDVVGQVNVERS